MPDYTPKQHSSLPTGHDPGVWRDSEEPNGLGALGTGSFWATTSHHGQALGQLYQVGLQEWAVRGERGWLVCEVVLDFLTFASRWEMCMNAFMALRLCLSGEGGFVPPADASRPRTEQDSCLEGLQRCFISYLWPCFLHVPFLQVVSRKLWHQLEQPKKKKREQHQTEGARGPPDVRGWAAWSLAGKPTLSSPLAPGPPKTALAERFGPTSPKPSEEAGAETRSIFEHFVSKATSLQEKPPGQIPLHRSAVVMHLLHQTRGSSSRKPQSLICL